MERETQEVTRSETQASVKAGKKTEGILWVEVALQRAAHPETDSSEVN